MSQTTMSGFSRAICRSAASPSTAVPTTVISAYSLRESDNTPSCNVLSSQINTRITRSLCRSCIFCFTFRHHTFRDILSISYLGTFWKFFLRINRELLSDKKMHIRLHKSDISRHACNRKNPSPRISMEMDFQDAPYCLAISTRLVKAAASFTAMSASILRLMSMLCFFRPLIKVE